MCSFIKDTSDFSCGVDSKESFPVFAFLILFAFFVPVNLPLLHKSWLALQSLNLANSGSYCLNFSILSFVLCFVGTVDVSDKNYAVTL